VKIHVSLMVVPAWLMVACAGVQAESVLQGKDAYGSWQADRPGTVRLIRPQDLAKPGASPSVSNPTRVTSRGSATPLVPQGFKIELLADGLSDPRVLRVAPNGDIFVAETGPGRIRVLRLGEDAKVVSNEVFASGLNRPFGIAFFPNGDNPQWVYVANINNVVRFPYRVGDLKASAKPDVVVANLAQGSGHSTRDVVFTPDGKRMLVSVGSASNVAEGMGNPPGGLEAWSRTQALGASWGYEAERAVVLSFTPEGKDRKLYATGIRNCVGLAIQPQTGLPWCSTNERDGLGDDLVPDYVTSVKEGGFYGWPWFYIGANEDPRHADARPDLKDKITVPDVLLQPHSASLGMTFYQGALFPSEYQGDAFAAEHGSWNRSKRTGYKVIRIRMKDGKPTGEYEDFATGFVVNDSQVWGRPVGIAVAKDGALLISEDTGGTIWRVTH
jgi:glucose/arabinose dehydrogenase